MHPPRIYRASYIGLHCYFLTFCTGNRRPVFVAEALVSPVLTQFRQSLTDWGFANLAYCFMPDHVHVLCEARREDADLLPCVSDAKQRSGYAFAQWAGSRLWQPGFYDHVLRNEDRVPAVVRYIMGNPVRAGLTRQLGEYAFCGSDVYSTEEIIACLETWSPPWATAAKTARFEVRQP